MFDFIKSFWWEFLSYFVPEKMEYEITGECKKCGKCCNYMYSFDTYTEKEFKFMQFLYPAYKRFYIKGKDEFGNFIFACKYVTPEGLCSVYDKRLAMCKRYPTPRKNRLKFKRVGIKWLPIYYPVIVSEALKLRYSADLHEGCGFTVHKKKFSDYISSKVKTVIFDLDGTLLYTLEDLADSVNKALNHFDYPERSIDEIRSFVGNGVQKLIERAIPQGVENPDFQACLELFKNDYKENMYNKTKPYDGIIEMLEKLENEGIQTAVVSNKFDLAVKELCEKYFPDKFSAVAGESENIRKKPAPDSVLKVMEQLNAELETTIFVGDSEVDIQTAQNAGIECISVNWGYKDTEFLKNSGAKVIVPSVDELLKKLLD